MKISTKKIFVGFLSTTFFFTILSTNSWGLSAADNLGKWRKNSKEERLKLSHLMIGKAGKGKISERQILVLSSSVYNCINETAGNGGLDNIKISETAVNCIVLIGNP